MTDEKDPIATPIVDALGRFESGDSTVVMVESGGGSASAVTDSFLSSAATSSRVVCASACRAAVGGVARDLDLDSFEGGIMVLEDAQWADPTSLGHLQRVIREGPHPYFIVIAHRSTSGVDGWWLDRLATTARTHATLLELQTGLSGDERPEVTLTSQELDFVVATSLIATPLSVSIASDLLQLDENEVFDVGDGLVNRGLLGQARAGYISVADVIPDVGEARVGRIAGKLADAIADSGGDDSVVGSLRVAAGQHDEAYPLLIGAARSASTRHAAGEAFHLAEAAIGAADETRTQDPQSVGEMHLICARFLRTAGRTELASSHIEAAGGHLQGPDRVEAIRLAAMVADDGQHPQVAERLTATAEWEASRLDDPTLLGSLLSFRARTLSRIGFADEADASLAKSRALLDHENDSVELFLAKVSEAWIHFDRGEAGIAEAAFTRLRDEAGELEGDASVADKEAWRARALFAAGRPTEALEAVRRAQDLASLEEVEAPLFLAQLALTEGNLALGRYEEALESSEGVLDLTELQLPAWENMARSLKANAYLRLGRHAEALEEIDRALEVTPEGADGWRWRIRCQALKMEIAAAGGGRWPENEAEDLADLMLHSRFYGWAAELLTAIAVYGKRKTSASEAMAIAAHAGLPMTAARAAEAGALWGEPSAAHVILGISAIGKRIPPEWEDTWKSLPHVKSGLSAPEPEDDEAFEAATAAMGEALQRAGLAAGAGTVLSPAQRRSKGLVHRPRRIHPLRLIAATLGIVIVAGATAFGVSQLTASDPIPEAGATTLPIATETTVPEPLALEDTQIAVAGASDTESAKDDFLSGVSEHRGGFARTGVVDVQGPREVNGFYWKFETASAFQTGPVAYGSYVYAGSTEGTFYALDQSDARRQWTLTPQGRISTAPAMGRTDIGEGADPMRMVVVDDDGVVQGHDATSDQGSPWSTELGARIRSSPVVVDGVAIVATTEGYLHGLTLFEGDLLWRYPEGEEGLGSVTADLAYDNGILYVATEEGALHVFDIGSGIPEPVCEYDANSGIVGPIIASEVVYVPTHDNAVWTLPAGECAGSGPGRQPVYATEYSIDVAPAVAGDVMYLPQGRYLYAMDMATGQAVWENGSVATPSGFPISSPPVVAGDVVYFASQEGVVYAIDAMTGEELWTWRTARDVRGAVAVVSDAVFISSGDGFVYAVGSGDVIDDE